MPTTWNQIVGHEWAVQLLAGAIQHNRVGQSYLITGPEQVGKTTLARLFAQALTCAEQYSVSSKQSPGSRLQPPCGQCRACALIAADRHPDVRLVKPEVSGRGKLTLKIEHIRELLQDLNLKAYEARYKIAILTRFDAATTGAANAFLKTLEEPPANVILLLTALDADALLPTISSRCRTIALRPLSPHLIEQSLTSRWRVPESEAHLLAHLADGRLGWAVRAAAHTAVLEARETRLDWLRQAVDGDRVARFALADKLSRKPEELPAILQTWLSWWRDLTLLTQGAARNGAGQNGTAVTNIDRQVELTNLARVWTAAQTLTSLKQTNLALWQLERNANGRLVLENLFLTYPRTTRER